MAISLYFVTLSKTVAVYPIDDMLQAFQSRPFIGRWRPVEQVRGQALGQIHPALRRCLQYRPGNFENIVHGIHLTLYSIFLTIGHFYFYVVE